MVNNKKSSNKAGCLAYTIGGMSFIPLIGVLFGIITIVWGFTIKHTKLKLIGLAGILFTVILYGSLYYFGFVYNGGIFDDLRAQLAKTQMNNVAQSIEVYKVQNGRYPNSMDELYLSLPESSRLFLYDPSQEPPELYYYKLIDENHYHIRALGRDGILNTADDILPEPIKNIGLIDDYPL